MRDLTSTLERMIEEGNAELIPDEPGKVRLLDVMPVRMETGERGLERIGRITIDDVKAELEGNDYTLTTDLLQRIVAQRIELLQDPYLKENVRAVHNTSACGFVVPRMGIWLDDPTDYAAWCVAFSLSEFKDYENLEFLGAFGLHSIRDTTNFLHNFKHKHKVKELNVTTYDLDGLNDYGNLESLTLRNFLRKGVGESLPIVNYKLKDLLEIESVKNGKLRELNLMFATVDWANPENRLALDYLREHRVHIVLPGDFHHEESKYPSTSQLITDTIDALGLSDHPKEAEEVAATLGTCVKSYQDREMQGDFLTLNTQGRVAKAVAKLTNRVYKVKKPDDYGMERSFFLNPIRYSGIFLPDLIVDKEIVNGELGVIVVQNLDNARATFSDTRELRENIEAAYGGDNFLRERQAVVRYLNRHTRYNLVKDNDDNTVLLGNDVINQGAKDIYEFISHYLFGMVAVHTSKQDGLILAPARHRPSSGQTYIEASKDIHSTEFKELASRYGFNVDDYSGILNEVSDGIEKYAFCPLIGDFKYNNTFKGRFIDGDRFRIGLPAEDESKWLEQAEFDLPDWVKNHFRKAVAMYQAYQDPEFAEIAQERELPYALHKANENLRVLSGKCCWNQELRDPYFANRAISAMVNLQNITQATVADPVNRIIYLPPIALPQKQTAA